jgi:hypothetical protein
MERKIDIKSLLLIKNTAPVITKIIIKEYSIIRNCSPVLFEIICLLYRNLNDINLLIDVYSAMETFLGKNDVSINIVALIAKIKIWNV